MSGADNIRQKYPILVALTFFIYISATAFILIFSASIGSVMASEKIVINSLPNVTNLDIHSDFVDVEIKNERLNSGFLVLVNNNYACKFDGDNLIEIYNKGNGKFKVADLNVRLNETVYQKAENMLSALCDVTENNNVMIHSAYRSKDLQEKLYTEDKEQKGKNYSGEEFVLLPGHSEHQTGYAFDLSIMDKDNFSVLEEGEEFRWLKNNCGKYGFILRYPKDKVSKTGIGYETWHYRYVGLPHSEYIMQNNLCLEEYVEFLKTRTIKNPLYTTDYTSTSWMVYYVPSHLGNSTTVQVPKDSEYQIYGNNYDGFIIAVKLQ